MKQELLKRATGSHPGWRNVAGAILGEWHSFSSSDVPPLREALRESPGGWVARSLGEIGTPEAIQALVEDLPNGSESQTGFALSDLGAKAVPYLFPLLESDKDAKEAAHVIGEMGSAISSLVPGWIAKAADSNQHAPARIAALRAIAAYGRCPETSCRALHPLLHDSNAKIRNEAETSLRSVHDPVVAEDVSQKCHPSADLFDSLAFDALRCLSELADYGPGASDVGLKLLPFLNSQNGAERSYGIATLGRIGFTPAIPQIEEALRDADWRVEYAAIRSLGWLGDVTAVPTLEKIASEHWLPEMRAKAKQVAKGLSSQGHIEPEDGMFRIDRDVLGPVPPCDSNHWRWGDILFLTPPSSDVRDTRLEVPDGRFLGTNHGEWGGELKWVPSRGEPAVLHKDNVVAIESDEDGPIVLFGLAHLGLAHGYAVHVTHDSAGAWKLTEVARLPTEPSGLIPLGSGLFAAPSEGRIVVFSAKQGILGLASCVPNDP